MIFNTLQFNLLQAICIFTCLSSSLFAQGVEESPSLDAQLLTLISTIQEKEKSIVSAKKQLEKQAGEIEKKQIQQKILIDEDIIRGMRDQFISISAGGEKVFVERKKVENKIDWQADLEAIFSPLIQQLKVISERPKIIENLEQDIVYWRKRTEELNRAVNYAKTTQNQLSNKVVIAEVRGLLSEAEKQYETAGQKLSLLETELEKVRAGDNPFWSNITSLVKSFAASMLYYLMIALFFGFVAFQIVKLIVKLPRLMVDKRKPKRYVFVTRTINLIQNGIGFSLAVVAYLVVLYGSGQWVLLVVSIIILMGLVLSLKNLIPKYFIEIKTLLNLGSVRQDERIVFNGLVWKINLIDIHTHLHNPALDAHLRVPIAQLIDNSSRPYHKHESWFPTKVGDVVIVDDGVFGEVKHQSMDVVEIIFGGSVFTYQTQQFLARRPRNLSSGFTVYETFGFDYQHQAESTTTMLTVYKDWIESSLKLHPVSEHCTFFTVEFEKAAGSSLDFKVIAAFTGEAANDYFRIGRIIQKASVDIANQRGWVIPFQQITIHQA
jgi:hypothetical protein